MIRCINCRKPVKASADMALLRTDLTLFGPDFAYLVPPSQDQGWFEIGPDCYKRVLRSGRNGLPIGTVRS